MSADMVRTAAAMAEAVKILAQGDNWSRALAVHHPGSGGRCASCGQRRPCTIASLAVAARGKATRRAAREAQRAVTPPTAPGATPGAPDPTPTAKPVSAPLGEAS